MTVTASGVSRTMWQCLSTDTKPTDGRVSINDCLFVTDTGQFFIYNGTAWNPYYPSGLNLVNSISSLSKRISMAVVGDSISAGAMGTNQDLTYLLITFTASVGGATSGTATGALPVGSGTFPFQFSDGEIRNVTVTKGGTSVTWTGALNAGSITSGFFIAPFSYALMAPYYENSKKNYQFNSFVTYASMRSDGAFYPFEFCYGFSGRGTVDTLSKTLPVMFGNPYGLPDCALVLIGTNDGPTGQNLTAAQVGANIKSICQQLIAAGVLPFLCQLLPRADGLITFTASVGGATSGTVSNNTQTGTTVLAAGTYPITFSTGEIRYGTSNGASPSVITWAPAINAGTVTQCEFAGAFSQFIDSCNLQVARVALELGIPHVPYFDRITNGHGTWAHTRMEAQAVRYTQDGIHPQPIANMIMGKVGAEVFQKWFPSARRANLPCCINDTNKQSYQNQNQFFTLYTGTLNSASSTPVVSAAGGWQFQPTQKQLGRIIDSTFAEAGVGHSMQKTTPSTGSEVPVYEGYAWNFFGDSANQISCSTNVLNVTGRTADANGNTLTPGDRIAIAFQFKFVPDVAAASTPIPQFTIFHSVLGAAYAGFVATTGASVDPVQIGGETGFESAYYYQEFTVPVGGSGTINGNYQYANFAGNSNPGDNVYLANLRIVNLTTGAILAP